jgi:hypothetical protein
MGIREALKDRPAVVRLAVGVLIVGAVIYLAQAAMSGSSMPTAKAYYTTDDGATQFVDSMDHLAPFDHHGKPAYRVWMFSTDGGKTRFPGYLERYTSQAKARVESEMQDFKSGKSHMPPAVGPADTEVKKIGDGNPWVSRADLQQSRAILQIPASAGENVEVQLP